MARRTKALGIALLAFASLTLPTTGARAHDSAEHGLEAQRAAAMRDAARAFLATLDDAQRATVMAALDDNQRRTGWSNLPAVSAPRWGLAVADMTAPQRRALHAMLIAAMSSQGYLKTTTSMWHEDVLRGMWEAALQAMPADDPLRARITPVLPSYDTELFYISIFGDPAADNWAWGLTGHHYAANFTVAGGRIGFTPMFVGANPQEVREGRFAGWRLLQHESDRAFALLGSLGEAQRALAVIAGAVDDELFLGKGRQDRLGAPVGVRASDLDPAQRQQLMALIEEYVGNASDEAATRQRAAILADGLETLYIAWWGPTGDPAARFMYRIHGPSILIDYVRERSPDGTNNHIHAIVRDPSNDYGSEWLGRHYQEAHQN